MPETIDFTWVAALVLLLVGLEALRVRFYFYWELDFTLQSNIKLVLAFFLSALS